MLDNKYNGKKSVKKRLIVSIVLTVIIVTVCVLLLRIIGQSSGDRFIRFVIMIIPIALSGYILNAIWKKYFNIKACRCNCGYNYDFPNDVKMTVLDSWWRIYHSRHGSRQYEYIQRIKFDCKCKFCGATKTFERSFSMISRDKYPYKKSEIPGSIYNDIVRMFALDDDYKFEVKDVQYDASVIYDENNNVISGRKKEEIIDANPVDDKHSELFK